MSASDSAAVSNVFVRLAERILGVSAADTGFLLSLIVRKAAHFTEYAVLAILLLKRFTLSDMAGKMNIYLLAFALSAAAALVDEAIQIFSSRGASLRDVLIDSAGAAAALLISFVFNKRKREEA